MSHSHNNNAHHHNSETSKGLRIAFWLNLAFSIIEFVGGFYANSTAIITDAIHDLGDALAIGVGAKMENVSNSPADSKYTQGYRRYSILSAILLSLILIIGASAMLVKALFSFTDVAEVKSDIMFYLAIFGILINGFAFLRIWKAEKEKGNNTKAIMFHLLEDVLGWVAVLIGSIIIYFTKWYWIDPLLTVIIAIYILSNALPNFLASIKILLQYNPISDQLEQIKKDILVHDAIRQIDQIHIFSMDGSEHIATLKLQLKNPEKDSKELKNDIKSLLQAYNISDVTIEFF